MPDNETLDRRSLYSSMFSRSAIHCHSQREAPAADYGALSSFFQKGGAPHRTLQDLIDQSEKIRINDHCSVISCEALVRTGKNPSQEFQYGKRGSPESIKLDSCDSFTHALRGVEDLVYYEVENSLALQKLIKKDVWTRDDRVTWEREVSRIVSSELAKVPGLDQYRALKTEIPQYDAEKRPVYLNELSQDIENKTQKIRFCCEEMSFVEGYLLQKADNHFLKGGASDDFAAMVKKVMEVAPAREEKTFGDIIAASKEKAEAAPRNYKTPGPYYFAIGDLNCSSADKDAGHHAFIVTPIGNIVEATVSTVNGHPYTVIANTSGIKDYIDKKPFVEDRFDIANSSVYGPSITVEGAQKARLEILIARAERSTSEFVQVVSALPDKAPALGVVMDAMKASSGSGKMSGETLGMVVDLMDSSRADLEPVSTKLEDMTNRWEQAIALAGADPVLCEIVRKRMEASTDSVLKNEHVRSLPADLLTLSTLDETVASWRDDQRVALAGASAAAVYGMVSSAPRVPPPAAP